MKPPAIDDQLLEMLFAGTPARIVDVATLGAPEAVAELDGLRETLGLYPLALEPMAPSVGLRDRIASALAGRSSPGERRSALVVTDMLVDYLTPGLPLHVPRAREIVPALAARIERARHDGEPVIYLCDRHEPGDPELEAWGTHAVAGTEGAEVVPELAPRDGDIVVPHRTYSGFYESDLASALEKLAVNTLVLTGCVTELGMFVTAADAMMRGYNVEVPADCQAGANAMAEQVAMATLSIMRPVERTHAAR